MTKVELGWLAGLLDAEGCFFARQNDNCNTTMGIIKLTMTEIEPMRKAATIFWQIIGKKPKIHAKKKIYTIVIGKKNAICRVVLAIAPYLIGKKKEAAVLLRAITYNDPDDVALLRRLKRQPEPSRTWPKWLAEGQETGREWDVGWFGWLAGFLDGDGSIVTSPPTVRVSGSNRWNIQAVKSICQKLATNHRMPRIRKRTFKNIKWRPEYSWQIRHRKMIERIAAVTFRQLTTKKNKMLEAVFAPSHPKVQSKA